VIAASGDGALTALDEINRAGFWVGFLAYELGRVIERTSPRARETTSVPDIAFVRFGDVSSSDRPPRFGDRPRVRLGPGRSSLTQLEHAAGVESVQELLAAGECYQVNLTRRITFDVAPDPLALFAAIIANGPAPHAGICAFGDALADVAIVSASPELFLRLDGRAVETRPIKGTNADASRLRASAKDHAENLMIVDLARNDLGRVCEFGTVRVASLFDIEAHPGLHHLVSTVHGKLRPEVDLSALIGATFPPASVTGAPKPRVMQAIEDLEPVDRGAYCGAFGWIDADHRRAELAVGIRTFTIAGGRTTFGVGGGIVADSRADLEWGETRLKAARLLEAAGAYELAPETVSAS